MSPAALERGGAFFWERSARPGTGDRVRRRQRRTLWYSRLRTIHPPRVTSHFPQPLAHPMPVPWLQLVQLVPSIVEVSRELLKRTKSPPPGLPTVGPQNVDDLVLRIAALEENERRQAELVNQIAQQLAALTRAVTALHRRVIWLGIALAATLAVAVGGYFFAA